MNTRHVWKTTNKVFAKVTIKDQMINSSVFPPWALLVFSAVIIYETFWQHFAVLFNHKCSSECGKNEKCGHKTTAECNLIIIPKFLTEKSRKPAATIWTNFSQNIRQIYVKDFYVMPLKLVTEVRLLNVSKYISKNLKKFKNAIAHFRRNVHER